MWRKHLDLMAKLQERNADDDKSFRILNEYLPMIEESIPQISALNIKIHSTLCEGRRCLCGRENCFEEGEDNAGKGPLHFNGKNGMGALTQAKCWMCGLSWVAKTSHNAVVLVRGLDLSVKKHTLESDQQEKLKPAHANMEGAVGWACRPCHDNMMGLLGGWEVFTLWMSLHVNIVEDLAAEPILWHNAFVKALHTYERETRSGNIHAKIQLIEKWDHSKSDNPEVWRNMSEYESLTDIAKAISDNTSLYEIVHGAKFSADLVPTVESLELDWSSADPADERHLISVNDFSELDAKGSGKGPDQTQVGGPLFVQTTPGGPSFDETQNAEETATT